MGKTSAGKVVVKKYFIAPVFWGKFYWALLFGVLIHLWIPFLTEKRFLSVSLSLSLSLS
jgi:hypothetical protein